MKKQCKRCERFLPLDAFYKNSLGKCGRQSKCIECYAELAKHLTPEQKRRKQEWKKNNPEKVRETARKCYAKDPKKDNKIHDDWWRAHPELKRAKEQRSYQKNKVKRVASSCEWQKNNPLRANAANSRRRARQRGAQGTHTAEETISLLKFQNHLCANIYCRADLRVTKKHLDHKTPLSRDGSNSIENLQWLCQRCNLSKHALNQSQWLSFLRLKAERDGTLEMILQRCAFAEMLGAS